MAGIGAERRPWPPVYDEASLRSTIKHAVQNSAQFFLPSFDDLEPCQGDVLQLPASVPILDQDGDVALIDDDPIEHWMVVANSCDVSRTGDLDPIDYAPIVPLVPLAQLDKALEPKVRIYSTSRMFFVPAWDAQSAPHVADFTRFVSIHRDALRSRAQIKARMQFEAWVLLNACLVRLLAREDNRYG